MIADGLLPDLVVTDHLMPGMTGVELAKSLRTKLPHVPILLVSGFAEAHGVPHGLPLLNKPFRNADLAQSVVMLTAGFEDQAHYPPVLKGA